MPVMRTRDSGMDLILGVSYSSWVHGRASEMSASRHAQPQLPAGQPAWRANLTSIRSLARCSLILEIFSCGLARDGKDGFTLATPNPHVRLFFVALSFILHRVPGVEPSNASCREIGRYAHTSPGNSFVSSGCSTGSCGKSLSYTTMAQHLAFVRGTVGQTSKYWIIAHADPQEGDSPILVGQNRTSRGCYLRLRHTFHEVLSIDGTDRLSRANQLL